MSAPADAAPPSVADRVRVAHTMIEDAQSRVCISLFPPLDRSGLLHAASVLRRAAAMLDAAANFEAHDDPAP